ncbi:MAG: monovalent cation/H(+) antiporter subunit G [Hyphomicrobiaceae bacterium]
MSIPYLTWLTWPLVLDVLSWVSIVTGGFFVVVGAIGLVRMPELFTRMHAASIIDTMGAGLLVFGMMMQAGLTLVTVKLFFILLLFFFTSPVITHALAQAAVQAGIDPELAEDRRERKLPEQKPPVRPGEADKEAK